MTDEEVLELILTAKSEKNISETHIDTLVSHLDDLFEADMGYSVYNIMVIMSNKTGKQGTLGPGLTGFLEKFYKANPHLLHWFAWMPYRYYMSKEVWEDFVDRHNAKATKNYPKRCKSQTGKYMSSKGLLISKEL